MIDDDTLANLWVTPKNDGDIRLDQGRTQKFIIMEFIRATEQRN